MLELKKENVQMLRVKNKAVSQVTFDVDYNVPDAKADMGRIVQSKADVSMDEVRLSEGKAFLKGSLNADILYVSENEGRICSLSASLPMDETVNLEGIQGGDKLCLSWEIEDLSVRMIHSRKLSIKAIVTFYAVVDELTQVQIPTALDENEISVKKKKVRLMSLCVHKKDTLRIKEDISLASNRPNIESLLWYTIEPRNLDLRPENDKIRAKGELSVFALYMGTEAENPPQWLEYALPFNSEVECTGCGEDLIPHIEVSVLHHTMEVKPDGDGEERILQADVVLELNMKLYRPDPGCIHSAERVRDTEKKGTAGKSSGAEFLQMQGDRPYRSQGKPGQSAAALSQQRQGKDRQHEDHTGRDPGRRCYHPEDPVYYRK